MGATRALVARPRNALFALAALIALAWLGRGGRPRELIFDGVAVRPGRQHIRLTLIMVYGGSEPAAYLSMLFQSIAANARDYDLLFVNVGDSCLDLSHLTNPRSPTYAPNIRPLCLTEAENDALAADWLCSGWGGCSREDRRTVDYHLERIHRERKGVEIFNTFKHWRGLVYKRYVKTDWWGFADADQIFGRSSGHLPFNLFDSFDAVFTTTHKLHTPAIFTPLMLFRYSAKMAAIPFQYPPFRSPAALADMQPGDHAHRLAEFVYSDFFVRNATSVDLLRVPDVMSGEPVDFNRRLVTIDGRLLSVDRNLPRHELQYWLNAMADDPPETQSFTDDGFTIAESLDMTYDTLCHGDVWNPSGACPTNRPSGALRTYLYRKNGVWYTRYDARPMVSAPDEMAPLEEKLFAHLQEIKHAPGLTLPDMVESGYHADRTSGARDTTSVLELTDQWWGRWRIRRGELSPPEGFEVLRLFGSEPREDDTYLRTHRQLAL